MKPHPGKVVSPETGEEVEVLLVTPAIVEVRPPECVVERRLGSVETTSVN